jgi:hypothetical protein
MDPLLTIEIVDKQGLFVAKNLWMDSSCGIDVEDLYGILEWAAHQTKTHQHAIQTMTETNESSFPMAYPNIENRKYTVNLMLTKMV